MKSGYLAIIESVADLVNVADELLKIGAIGQSTAIATIALEECGKAFLLDSLLFAKPRDGREQGFRKESLSHKRKLHAAIFF